MTNYNDFDATITELKKEVQYIKDRYDAPVEVLEELAKKINESLFLYNGALEEQKKYNDYLNNELKRRVIPAEINPNFEVPDILSGRNVTTPFRDDIEIGNYQREELGEVEDVFNVEINCHGDNKIVMTRRVIRANTDDGSYLQSMVDVLSKLKNNK